MIISSFLSFLLPDLQEIVGATIYKAAVKLSHCLASGDAKILLSN